MAITTLDGAIAGMQPTRFFSKAITPTLVAGKPQSLWGLGGIPGAGSFDTTLNGVTLSSTSSNVNGQLPWVDPGAGTSYLARLVADATVGGKLLVCDRLWHNGGYTITSTAAQGVIINAGSWSGGSITYTTTAAHNIGVGQSIIVTGVSPSGYNGTFTTIAGTTGSTIVVTASNPGTYTSGGTVSLPLPARDINGATSGVGVLLGLEISGAAGAAAPTITVTYTNSSGTASRTAGFAFATANSPAAGSFFPIGLQAGDVGVQSMQSIQLSTSWLSGTMNMVAYRVMESIEIPGAYVANAIDLVTGGMSQMFNGTVPFLIFIPSTTTASYVSGTLTVTQG